MTDHAAVPIHALAELRERQRVTISLAALAALDEAGGQRARVRYRLHPLYPELAALHRIALTFRSDVSDVGVTGVAIAADPPALWLTAEQAAHLAGITTHGVRAALRTGRLEGVKRHGRWWVPAGAAAAYATADRRERGARRPSDQTADPPSQPAV